MKKDKSQKHIKSIKNILKKNTKLLIGLIAGVLVATTTVYGAIKMSSSDVYYDKTTSGLSSSNVQGAIDELKTKANSCGSGGLQVGDYFTLVPDKSTYTIAGSETGYTKKVYVPDSGIIDNLNPISNTEYFCCSATMPPIYQGSNNAQLFHISGTYTRGDAISGKYCWMLSSVSTNAGSCSANGAPYIHKPNTNATSAESTISATRYTPTLSDQLTDQTITPNELTLWRIIKVNDNGTYDAVSEYVSSTDVYFQGTRGYANFVGALQTIATSYAKSGYTTATRMMGYDGQTLTISNTSVFDGSTTTAPSETSTPSPTTGTGQEYGGGVLGDTLYLKDYQLVSNVYKQDNNIDNYCETGVCSDKQGEHYQIAYWLASRRYNYSRSDSFRFGGRAVIPYGGLNGSSQRSYYDSSWNDYSDSYALRPIITLKSGVTISGGHGIKSEPYTFS